MGSEKDARLYYGAQRGVKWEAKSIHGSSPTGGPERGWEVRIGKGSRMKLLSCLYEMDDDA